MSEKESVKPIAYRFKNNRGNGQFEYDYYDADEVSSAYRDNCIEITPLYTADRIDQLEKELAEARKDAEPPELLTNIHALSEWACDVIDETVSELLKHNPTSDAANKLYMVAGRLSALSSDISHWQESRDAAIDAAMEAK